jgi:hypothetical protein
LGLSDLKKTKEKIQKLKDERLVLLKERDELSHQAGLGRFYGSHIWLKELDDIEQVIIEGQKTFWKFGDHNKYEL